MLLIESGDELTDTYTHSSRWKSTGFIVLINIKSQSPSEANSHSSCQEFSQLLRSLSFIRAHHKFVSWTTKIHSTLSLPASFRFILLISCNKLLSLFFSFPTEIVYVLVKCSMRALPRPFNSSRFHHPNSIS